MHEDLFNRVQRKVGKMFVVDRVELAKFDQLHQVREFQRNGSAGLQRKLQSASKVIDVGHVRVHVIARDQVGLSSFLDQAPCQLRPEKLT